MKKLLLVPAFMLAFFFSTISSVSAADVWVDHWDSENKDIYVVEDTISGNSTDFSVVVKDISINLKLTFGVVNQTKCESRQQRRASEHRCL